MQTIKEAATNRRLMAPSAASQYIGLSESTLAKMRCRGDGPAYHKLSSRVFYDSADCDRWLAERRRTSTSEAA